MIAFLKKIILNNTITHFDNYMRSSFRGNPNQSSKNSFKFFIRSINFDKTKLYID